MTILLDPNVLYVLLLGSLWLTAIAVITPGTGILETLGIAGVLVSIVLLAQVPVNWLAVILIGAGTLSLLVLSLLIRRSVTLALLGAVTQVIGGLLLFPEQPVSLIVIAVMAFLSVLYLRFVLYPAHHARHLAPAMLDDVPLVGQHGLVQSAIDPVGTVRVRGESWTARSETPLATGAHIVVSEQDGLTLMVRPVKIGETNSVESGFATH